MSLVFPTAAERVFNTTELLELILVACDPLTILRASRTSRHFESVISASLKVQQALYLKPDWTAPGINYGLNPLFLLPVARNGSRLTDARIYLYTPNGSPYTFAPFKISKPGACLDMLLSQPPQTKFVTNIAHEKSIWNLAPLVVTNPEGIKWGDVCEGWADAVWEPELYPDIIKGAEMSRIRKAQT